MYRQVNKINKNANYKCNKQNTNTATLIRTSICFPSFRELIWNATKFCIKNFTPKPKDY